MNRSHAEDLELAERCASGDAGPGIASSSSSGRCCIVRPTHWTGMAARVRWPTRSMPSSTASGTREGQRQSLFRYFQGRSSLATWLRAVLAQRYVDRQRAQRRLAPLADDDAGPGRPQPPAAVPPEPDPARRTIRCAPAPSARGGARRAGATGAAAARVLLRPGTDARRNRPRDAGARGHRVTPAGAHAPGDSRETSNAGSGRRG